ncbi:putative sulfonylurea receptor, AAA+ ATPase domain-containing protein [Plasmopara halstedii]
MHLLSVYCVAFDGSLLSSEHCSQLLLLQASHLVLLLLCTSQVLRLAGGHTKGLNSHSEVDVVLFVLHFMAIMATIVFSIVQTGVAMMNHLSASLVIGASITVAALSFYAVETLFEFLQHTKSKKIITFVVFLGGIEEIMWRDPTIQSSERLAILMHWKVISYAITAIIAVIRMAIYKEIDECVEEYKQSKLAKKTVKDSPLDRIGWISQLSFNWISPFIVLGQKRRLELNDIPNLPRREATSIVTAKFHEECRRELGSHQPSFLRLARRLYGANILIFALWSTFNKAIGLASPLLLKFFLDWADSSTPSLTMGYILAVAMGTRSILAAVSGTQYDLAWKRFDLQVRAGLQSAIYMRTLELSSQERREAGGLGRITNLLSVDVGRIVGMPGQLFELILIPIEILVALIVLSQAVSVAFIAGLAALAIMLPLQTILGRKIQSVTKDMMRYRDTRVSLAAESLKAIRTLKLLGWVNLRRETMSHARSLEMGRLQLRKYLDAFCVFSWASTPVVVQVAVFGTAIFLGQAITAANAFTAIALLDRLIFPMNYFPWIISGFLEARVSALRIRDFLFNKNDLKMSERMSTESHASEFKQEVDAIVSIHDAEFRWSMMTDVSMEDNNTDPDTPLLINTSFSSSETHQFVLRIKELQLRPGSIYIVCGPVGAGKSSLLLALIGEMSCICGRFDKKLSTCSYSPQTPWLFRGSVEANVTLCKDDKEESAVSIDWDRYEHIIRACELEADFRNVKCPVNVAESGGNFSGGQRARINLARALYQRAHLYLLDDPFSGLDGETASKVVTNCFNPNSSVVSKDAAVVVVTHSLNLLPYFSPDAHIIVMDDGCIVEQGTYDVLKTSTLHSRFMSLLSSSGSQERTNDTAKSDREKPEVNISIDAKSLPEKIAQVSPVSSEDDEERETGAVSWRIWKSYALDVGWILAIVIVWMVLAMQITRNSLDWWIAVYTDGKHAISPRKFALVLLYIACANILVVFLRSFLFAYGGLRAARVTYKKLVQSVFAAPLSFFERTPAGRILNRLSGDTCTVDETLPFILNLFLRDAAELLGLVVILFYGNRLVLVVLVPLSILYFHLQRVYRPSSRHLKRLDAVTQSPLLAMFTDTLDGLTVIRAAQKQQQYAHDYGERLNRSQRVSFLGSTTSAWFGLRLDLLGVCVTSFVAVFAVADFHMTGKVNPGTLGLTLTYALPIVGKLNALLNSFVDSERQMIAVERVKEYMDLESEEHVVKADSLSKVSKLPNMWPSAGHIVIKDLTVTYGPPTSDLKHHELRPSQAKALALNNVNCDIPAGQKVGICGRTGAGKSTLLNALFRTVPWEYGSNIIIDNVPLSSVGLDDLRSRLTYVPQDVVLFSGTIRSNLDPSGVIDDEQLWTVLRKCGGLANTIAKLDRGLDFTIQGGAKDLVATFSQGQAQLLCIARALLRPSKILCIDEATASIDEETERMISEAIASEFAASTVLTVAHRIQTILHCERVLLLENGRIVESGAPKELSQTRSHSIAEVTLMTVGKENKYIKLQKLIQFDSMKMVCRTQVTYNTTNHR